MIVTPWRPWSGFDCLMHREIELGWEGWSAWRSSNGKWESAAFWGNCYLTSPAGVEVGGCSPPQHDWLVGLSSWNHTVFIFCRIIGVIGSCAQGALLCLPASTCIPFRIWRKRGILPKPGSPRPIVTCSWRITPDRYSMFWWCYQPVFVEPCAVTQSTFCGLEKSNGEISLKLWALTVCHFVCLMWWSSQTWSKVVVNSLVQAVDVQAMLSEMIASNNCGTTAGKRGFGERKDGGYYVIMHLPMS